MTIENHMIKFKVNCEKGKIDPLHHRRLGSVMAMIYKVLIGMRH
jgi:hypothetical protein